MPSFSGGLRPPATLFAAPTGCANRSPKEDQPSESSMLLPYVQLFIAVGAGAQRSSALCKVARIFTFAWAGYNLGFRRWLGKCSCTVKDSCQFTRVVAFTIEGAQDGSEGLRERKDVARNEQIGILRPYRMPVHAFSSNCDFRD
jgi:hypothetical protein